MRSSSLLLALSIASAVASHPGPAGAEPRDALEIVCLSSRPDMVTGGDALVRVTVPATVPTDQVTVTLDGADVTAKLRRDAAAGTLTGIVDGLVPGENRIRAAAGGGRDARAASLALVNHPKEGPVFSGPHQTPFVCETDRFRIPVFGRTLGAPTGADCSLSQPFVGHFYRSKGTFKVWPPDPNDPTDVPEAVPNPVGPGTVPFIVRLEVGTANRGIYEIMVLHDPRTEPDPAFDPEHRPKAWNGRLYYLFGTGCTGGWYHQGRLAPFANEATGQFLPGVNYPITRGYVLASSTLNDNGTNCNDVVAAETMMTTKERVVEEFGPPTFTIGVGLSGGAVQAQMIADDYPGLVDGIVPGGNIPDPLAAWNLFRDVLLLDTFFKARGASFTAEQRAAVAGLDHWAPATLAVVGSNADPLQNCPQGVALPPGTRCDIFTAYRNVYGEDDETHLVRRAFDNVGVQYGLAALNLPEGDPGRITPAQFLELNEGVGGFPAAGGVGPQPAEPGRTEADPAALRRAYATGRVTSAGLGLASIPIIDFRGYSEDRPSGDPHPRYFSFAMRERLRKANGRTDNQVMLVEDLRNRTTNPDAAPLLYNIANSKLLQFAIEQMGHWLDAIAADHTDAPQIEKVAHARPPALLEGCLPRGANTTPDAPASPFIHEDQTTDPTSACARLYPVHSSPRVVAGGPPAEDVLKCQLRPIDPADYPVAFSAEELARLHAIFPRGVCDYRQPGVGQRPPRGPWLRFGGDDDARDGS